MADEDANTADLTIDEKLDQVLRKLGDMDGRLAKLEAAAADRARETRPKLDLIIAEVADLREGQKDLAKRLDRIDSRLETLAFDILDVRGAQRRLGDRVDVIERNAA